MNELINKLTTKMTMDIAATNEGKNVVCSPISLIILLAIVANAADGKTQQEILSALEVESLDELNEAVGQLEKTLSQSKSLSSANAVCTSEDYKARVKISFINMMRQLYDAEIMTADSAKGLTLERIVNDWVKDKTHGMIDKLVDDMNEDIKVVLMNALAFEGEWLEPYEDEDIKEDVDFKNYDGSVSKVRMLSHDEETYVENDEVIGFIKEYEGFDYSYMVVIPKDENTTIDSVIDRINISELYNNSKWGQLITMMPEFEVETEKELTGLVQGMGIKDAFTDKALFENMIEDADLLIDSIIQKAYIKVDRNGTKAAAVSAAMMRCMALPMEEEPIEITIDRPFMYAVVNNDLRLPVFTGVVKKL